MSTVGDCHAMRSCIESMTCFSYMNMIWGAVTYGPMLITIEQVICRLYLKMTSGKKYTFQSIFIALRPCFPGVHYEQFPCRSIFQMIVSESFDFTSSLVPTSWFSNILGRTIWADLSFVHVLVAELNFVTVLQIDEVKLMAFSAYLNIIWGILTRHASGVQVREVYRVCS